MFSCDNPSINQGKIMTAFKALLDFVTIPLKTKPIFFKNVITHLTNNPFYTTPDIPLETLQSAVDDLELAILAAADGSHIAISAMHDSADASTLLFKHTVGYVNRMANGELTKILSSGFTASSQPVARDKEVLTLSDGPRSGTAKATTHAVEHAGAFSWEKRITSAAGVQGPWEPAGLTTQTTIIIEGLEVRSILEVKVAAVTTTGVTDFCAPVSIIIK